MSIIQEMLEKGKDYYLERADLEIENHRKGNFRLTITENKAPLTDIKISYVLKRHDFAFGCNIFMLDQYAEPSRQETYLTQWKKLFNTAVVPLYWEGTEPTEGELRYEAAGARSIYRRPTVERVVEYCKENNIVMKGHPLFWHEFIPKWLPDDWSKLLPLIEKRFSEISSRYADEIPVFDCVNEPGRIWDMTHEHRTDGYKMITPPDGYLEEIFALGKKYFPNNTLILNEAVSSALCEFKGIYGSYYQLIERLLAEGLKIDNIGLQCHCKDDLRYQNIFDARRFYGVLDGYAKLGKPLVLSEIGLSSEDEELQAKAAEQIYKICFSHPAMNGIFWWNLDDDGILQNMDRVEAAGENLPFGGLCRRGREKKVYKTLNRLINHEWHTEGSLTSDKGDFTFRGFYGTYTVTVQKEDTTRTYTVDFGKNADSHIELEW